MIETYRNKHDGHLVFISGSEVIDSHLVLIADNGERWESGLFLENYYSMKALIQRVGEIKAQFCEWFNDCFVEDSCSQSICLDPRPSAGPLARIKLTSSIVELEGKKHIIGVAGVQIYSKDPEIWTEIKELDSFCLIRKLGIDNE